MTKIKSFRAISDLLYFSIEQQNEPLARELYTFIQKCFTEFRKDKPGISIIYPEEYYNTIFEANERICLRKKKTLSSYNSSTLLHFFFDSFQNTKLSDNTYFIIWRCLRQELEYDADDMIISYWEFAHQHFDHNLQRISVEYDENTEPTNLFEIKKRDEEREQFLEFHYAFGGLLMYKQKYKLLGRLMKYTSSQPPRYVLVPDTMAEVINRYMKIQEPLLDPWHFENRFSFPEISGVNRGSIIRMWIKRYFAVLFLRQYTLQDFYYNSSPLELPQPPKDLSELSCWEQELENLTKYVDEYLDNKSILKEFEFPLFVEQWFDNNNKQKPLEIIKEIKNSTKIKFEKIKKSQQVSQTKKEQFKNITRKIVLKAIESYNQIRNTTIFTTNRTWLITGIKQVIDKTAFADNSDVSYLNFDSGIASLVATNYRLGISETFYSIPSKSYCLEEKDIFPAIDKLNIDYSKYVIVSFGINFSYYIDFLEIKGLAKDTGEDAYNYNSIKIFNYQICQRNLVGSTFFILKVDDLPNIIHNEISDIEKFKLEELDEASHLSASIVNLNEESILRKEIEDELSEKDLTKSVLVCIALSTEIRWKESINCISIKVYSQFLDRVVPDKLSDIQPIQ